MYHRLQSVEIRKEWISCNELTGSTLVSTSLSDIGVPYATPGWSNRIRLTQDQNANENTPTLSTVRSGTNWTKVWTRPNPQVLGSVLWRWGWTRPTSTGSMSRGWVDQSRSRAVTVVLSQLGLKLTQGQRQSCDSVDLTIAESWESWFM
jgi:hypothetical protein